MQDRDAERRVAQPDDHLALMYHSSLFDELFFHHAALERTELNGRDRLYLSVHAYVVVELSLLCGFDCQQPFVDF